MAGFCDVGVGGAGAEDGEVPREVVVTQSLAARWLDAFVLGHDMGTFEGWRSPTPALEAAARVVWTTVPTGPRWSDMSSSDDEDGVPVSSPPDGWSEWHDDVAVGTCGGGVLGLPTVVGAELALLAARQRRQQLCTQLDRLRNAHDRGLVLVAEAAINLRTAGREAETSAS